MDFCDVFKNNKAINLSHYREFNGFDNLTVYFFHFFLANEDGRFVEEIVPVSVKGRKGPEEFKVDEHPKPNSTIESLAKLPPVFKKDGTITAANASVRCFLLKSRKKDLI